MAAQRQLLFLALGRALVFQVHLGADLEGREPWRIRPNALFRAWGLGEKKKNNGVLLLVAPNERKVRIEVGYGLEGTLTDALSKIIISNAMALSAPASSAVSTTSSPF